LLGLGSNHDLPDFCLWVARNTGMSHWHLAHQRFLKEVLDHQNKKIKVLKKSLRLSLKALLTTTSSLGTEPVEYMAQTTEP
jgi:metal-dependent hydrolase (beta-lactamase superfamily II)